MNLKKFISSENGNYAARVGIDKLTTIICDRGEITKSSSLRAIFDARYHTKFDNLIRALDERAFAVAGKRNDTDWPNVNIQRVTEVDNLQTMSPRYHANIFIILPYSRPNSEE